jgi:hypothetical protein
LIESLKREGSGRSMMAPFGTRPAVVTPWVIWAASPVAEKPETMIAPWATA